MYTFSFQNVTIIRYWFSAYCLKFVQLIVVKRRCYDNSWRLVFVVRPNHHKIDIFGLHHSGLPQ